MSLSFTIYAQSFSINTDGSTANASAILDVKSTLKGLLIPRMTRSERNAIPLPAMGLIIFQNGPDSVGLYYYTGIKWSWIFNTANSDSLVWKTGGNKGTTDINNFIGTTDNIPFNIRVNNNRAARIDHLAGNAFLGYQAGNNNSTGIGNTANGHTAFFTNTTGNNNTVSGQQALYFNNSGGNNSAIGYAALINNAIGNNNTANGFYALYNNVAGSNATAIGTNAMLYANNTGTAFTNSNVALGFEALRGSTIPSANTGYDNTAVGYQTLLSNTTGFRNVAGGVQALSSNLTGNANSAFGFQSLNLNTIGYSNTASGFQALYSNSSGHENTAYGVYAIPNIASGNDNTAIGMMAGNNLSSGNNNILIGYNAQPSGASTNNEVTIGNALNNAYRMYASSWTNASDARLKHNIRDIPAGLEFIKQLHPVEYVYNNANNEETSLGFIAQEVQGVINNSALEKSSLVSPLDKTYLGLKTTELIPILTKALQEQQLEIVDQKNLIKLQNKRLDKQEKEIHHLKKNLDNILRGQKNTRKS